MYFLHSLKQCIPKSDIQNAPELRETDYESRFLRASDRENFLRRRICLYRILEDYFLHTNLDSLNKNDVLVSDTLGKPYLLRADEDRYTSFNLSTRSDALVVALTEQQEIGVDIEDTNRHLPPSSMEAVMEFYFSTKEREYVLAKEDVHSRSLRFLMLWTRKEAAVKMLGKSILSHGLLVRSLNDSWLEEEDGGPVRGASFFVPGCDNLVVSIARKTPIDEGKIEKRDARILFEHPMGSDQVSV